MSKIEELREAIKDAVTACTPYCVTCGPPIERMDAALAEVEALAVVGQGAIANRNMTLAFGDKTYCLLCERTDTDETWYLSEKISGGLTFRDIEQADTWQDCLCQAGLLEVAK